MYRYDALGRRIEKRVGQVTTRYVWDGNVMVHEVRTEADLPPRTTSWIYEPGAFAPAGKVAPEGAKYSVVTDYLGTPTEMYDEAGKLAWQAQLDLYGVARTTVGTKDACPFRWPGQYEDEETGLYYNRFRYYDPQRGGYLSKDPIGLRGGLEPYGYVPDPTTHEDPFGLHKTRTRVLRRLWNEYTGGTASGAVHHGLPEQFASEFQDLAGIDVNNPKYFFDLSPAQHTLLPAGIHTTGSPLGQEWNASWASWLEKNRERLANMEQEQARAVIERRLSYVADRAGIKDERSTKKKGCCE